MRVHDAATLSWSALQKLAAAGATALLPVGSTEAHGPHLPLSVDVVIAQEVCRRVGKARADLGRVTVIYPPLAYALTDFAAPFAGTVSLKPDTARAHLVEVLQGIKTAGFKTVAVVNHHLEPAHFKLVREAAKEAGAIAVDHRHPPFGPRLGEEFMHGGSHAGGYETSLMLAAAPELVDEEARAALPPLEIDLPGRIKAGAKNFLECGGDQAYFGDPRAATSAEGERLFGVLVEATLHALGEG
jgi:creatinine amidohydrolase